MSITVTQGLVPVPLRRVPSQLLCPRVSGKSEVRRLTGIARTAIDRIVGSGHEGPAERGAE